MGTHALTSEPLMQKIALYACALILSAACTAETTVEHFGQGPDKPLYVRLGFSADPATTASVIWYTEKVEIQGAGVEYGQSAEFGKFSAAESFEISGFTGQFHEAKLFGLAPGSIVKYRVGGKSGVSSTHSFPTAPAADEDAKFSFVLLGDSRAEFEGIGAGYPELLARLGKENPLPSFVLDSGDFTNFSQPAEWFQWLKAGQGSSEKLPRMTAFGNHEWVAQTYYSLMNLPEENDGKWYSLRYGPLLIMALNTGLGHGTLDKAQIPYVEKILSESDAPWKLVFFHMGPYNAGNHNGKSVTQEIRDQWVPLFEKYGVDLVVSGHDHNYQRFGNLREGAKVGPGEGPFYLISGGAGAPLYSARTESADYQLLDANGFVKTEHYILATLDGDSLKLEAKKLDGSIFDTILLTK
jgi:acid phosphatase type 7